MGECKRETDENKKVRDRQKDERNQAKEGRTELSCQQNQMALEPAAGKYTIKVWR